MSENEKIKFNFGDKFGDIPYYNYNIQNYTENLIFKIQQGIHLCAMQLSDAKKIANGFYETDSVIDVEEGGYAISYGDEFLFTYGIEPCCGVVLYDDKKYILFHLDGSSTPEEVKQITDKLDFSNDAKVLICPGVSCGKMSGTFNYVQLENIYKSLGYNTIVQRIEASFGHITVSPDYIKVGSLLLKGNENYFDSSRKQKE